MPDPSILALIFAATALAMMLQCTAGFGFNLIMAPVLIATIDPVIAVLLMSVLGLASNGWILVSPRRQLQVDWTRGRTFLIWALPGMALGLLCLAAASRSILLVAAGVAVLLALAFRLWGPGSAPDGRWYSPIAGFVAGAMTTSVHVHGPPTALWLLGRPRTQYRDTLAMMLLILNAVSVPPLVILAASADADLLMWLLLLCLPAVVAGRWAALAAARLMTARFEHALTMTVIIVAGVSTLLTGLSQM